MLLRQGSILHYVLLKEDKCCFTPIERFPCYPLNRRLDGPQSLSERCGKENVLRLTETELRPLGCLVCNLVTLSTGLSALFRSNKTGDNTRYLYAYCTSRLGDRIPVGVSFSALVQSGPEVDPASYTVGTGSLLGVKRPARGVDHPSHLAQRLKKE